MLKNRKCAVAVTGVIGILLSACMAKDVVYTDQQKRMQRCDQYIDREREQCLKGDYVTIDEYQDDYKEYKKSKEEEEKKDQLKLPKTTNPPAKPMIKLEEDKPVVKPVQDKPVIKPEQ